MLSENLQLLPYLGAQVSVLWMESAETFLESIQISQVESLPMERTDARKNVRRPSPRLGWRLEEKCKASPCLSDRFSRQLRSAPYRIDLCVLRENRETNVAPNPTCPSGRRPQRRAFFDRRGREKIPRYEEELLHLPPNAIIFEKHKGWGGSCLNASDHRFIGRIGHARAKRTGLALELEGLFAARTPEVHDLGAGERRFNVVRGASGAVEVGAGPRFGDDPRDLSPTCVGSRKTGIESKVHGNGWTCPDLELAVILRQHTRTLPSGRSATDAGRHHLQGSAFGEGGGF